jgi:hypothetical protein
MPKLGTTTWDAKADEMASKMGQSRAALINRAIYELAERVVS